MAYCLDTNIIVFCLRGKSAKAINRLRSSQASDIRIPMQVLAELRLGAEKSAKPVENRQLVDAFVKTVCGAMARRRDYRALHLHPLLIGSGWQEH